MAEKINYSDLEELRSIAKTHNIENAKRKPEKDIVEELTKLGIEVAKIETPDELLGKANALTKKADEVRSKAIEGFTEKAKNEAPVDFNSLRKAMQKIDEKSDILKKVKENEAIVHRPR